MIAAAKNPSCRASNRLWSRERELREPRVASSWPGRDANWFSDSIRMCRFLNYIKKIIIIAYLSSLNPFHMIIT